MPKIVKCAHCQYLNYLDQELKQCPKCGSSTQEVENPFGSETIKVKITDTRRKKHIVEVTFDQLSKIIDNMINNSLKKVILDDGVRTRIIFMIKAYTWLLLKIQPQLWIDIDVVVNGIKELMTLKIEKGE